MFHAMLIFFFQNFHSAWIFFLQFQGRAIPAKTSGWKMTGFSIYWMGCLGPCLGLSNGHPIPQFQSQTSPNKNQCIIVRDIITPRKTHECHVNIKGWFRCISYWNSLVLGNIRSFSGVIEWDPFWGEIKLDSNLWYFWWRFPLKKLVYCLGW